MPEGGVLHRCGLWPPLRSSPSALPHEWGKIIVVEGANAVDAWEIDDEQTPTRACYELNRRLT